MKPKEPLTINLNVDWRVLVVLGIAVSLLVLAYSVAGAQAGTPPDATTIPTETEASLPEPAATSIPASPQMSCPDDLLPTTNGDCIPASEVGVVSISAASDVGISAIGGGVRHFYLTNRTFYANTALNACAAGYHMASLWEILNVASLTYDNLGNDNLGTPITATRDDSGYGPPSNWNGWVRTGYISDTTNTPAAGKSNCQAWTSNSGSFSGTNVMLTNDWASAPGKISAWNASTFTCNIVGSVWCVK